MHYIFIEAAFKVIKASFQIGNDRMVKKLGSGDVMYREVNQLFLNHV